MIKAITANHDTQSFSSYDEIWRENYSRRVNFFLLGTQPQSHKYSRLHPTKTSNACHIPRLVYYVWEKSWDPRSSFCILRICKQILEVYCRSFWLAGSYSGGHHLYFTISFGDTPLKRTRRFWSLFIRSFIWCLWRERNNITFKDKFQPFNNFFNGVLVLTLSWCKCYFTSFSNYSLNDLLMSWKVFL